MERRSGRSRHAARRFDDSVDTSSDGTRRVNRKSTRLSGEADASDTDSTGPVRRRRTASRKGNGARCVPESEVDSDVKADGKADGKDGKAGEKGGEKGAGKGDGKGAGKGAGKDDGKNDGKDDGKDDEPCESREMETSEQENASVEDFAAKEIERRERSRQARECRQMHEQVCRNATAFMFTFFNTVVLSDVAQSARWRAPLATVSGFAGALAGTRTSRYYDDVRGACDSFRNSYAHRQELESFARDLKTIATAVSPVKRRIPDTYQAPTNPGPVMPDAFACGEW